MEHDAEGWAGRHAASIGRRVAYFRERQEPKMTAQALADRCTELGHPIDRSVIAKLERGYRRTVSSAEVRVLARALRVPPLLLEYPVGEAGLVEVLPGVEVEPWDAARWAMGDMTTPVWMGSKWDDVIDVQALWPEDRKRPGSAAAVVTVFRRHNNLVADWMQARHRAATAEQQAEKPETAPDAREAYLREAEAQRKLMEQLTARLRDLRQTMREEAGLAPPSLPPGLYADEPAER